MLISFSSSLYVYHVTDLEEINEILLQGLLLLEYQSNNYHGFYKKLCFYRSTDLRFWWRNLTQIEIPVCLRTKIPLDAQVNKRYMLSETEVPPRDLEVWNGRWTNKPATTKMKKEFNGNRFFFFPQEI